VTAWPTIALKFLRMLLYRGSRDCTRPTSSVARDISVYLPCRHASQRYDQRTPHEAVARLLDMSGVPGFPAIDAYFHLVDRTSAAPRVAPDHVHVPRQALNVVVWLSND